MDHTEDVERLFSWLKAPMVHYREFAPQQEVAAAVATWPVVYKAAVQTGMAADGETSPQGDIAAKERIARERMTMPASAAQTMSPSPPPGTEVAPPELPTAMPPETPAATPSADWLVAALGERVATQDKRAEAAAEPAPQTVPDETIEPWRDAAEPVMTGFDQPPAPVRQAPAARGEPYVGEPAEPAGPYPAREHGALFGGEYRGREREVRPSTRVADRQDRSLDAVFSRLSGARSGLPDPRGRARTSPGLGAVFGRLR